MLHVQLGMFDQEAPEIGVASPEATISLLPPSPSRPAPLAMSMCTPLGRPPSLLWVLLDFMIRGLEHEDDTARAVV